MRKIIFILSVFTLFFSCKEEIIKKQIPIKIDGFHIIGTIKQFNDKTVFLQKQQLDKTYTTINETVVKENSFDFSGQSTDPKLIYLGFENSEHKIPVIVNNFETFVNIDIKDLDKTEIIGSTIQNSHILYLNGLVKAKNKFVYQLDYIKEKPNSLLSIIILEQMLGKTKWRLNQNRKAYDNLSNEVKASELGQSINTFLTENEPLVKDEKLIEELSLNPEVANAEPIVQVIKEAPVTTVEIPKPTPIKPKIKKVIKRRKALNFSAESQHGGDISLNQVKKGAKVTLIDFWASWCGPCRKSNPHLIQLYNKYHDKGFNILGVSEDKESDKSLWINAIAIDGLPWQQVIDDYGRIAEMYNVSGIPHTVLLDSEGGIIFQKKSSYSIEKKLKEIFGF